MYQAERRLQILYYIDLSASMMLGLKLHALVYIASTLLALSHRMEDYTTLVLDNGALRIHHVPPLEAAVRLVDAACKGGVSGVADVSRITKLLLKIRPRLTVAILDPFHSIEGFEALAKAVRASGTRLLAILCFTRFEVEKPLDKLEAMFTDVETPHRGLWSMDELYRVVKLHLARVESILSSLRSEVILVEDRSVEDVFV